MNIVPMASHFPQRACAGGAAMYVDRILKGAKPADLPVRQPTKCVLAVNLEAARPIDLTIPQSVLVQAERSIE